MEPGNQWDHLIRVPPSEAFCFICVAINLKVLRTNDFP